jgi:hypothetical protein
VVIESDPVRVVDVGHAVEAARECGQSSKR